MSKYLGIKNNIYQLHVKDYKYSVYGRYETSDPRAFREILVEEEYSSLDGIKNPRLIVDCGAYVGYSSIYFLNRYPEAHLIAVEPNKLNFDICHKNLFSYGKRVTLIKAAIWPYQTGLIVHQDDPHKGWAWGLQVRECKAGEKPYVNAVNINDLLLESDFYHIDILKIDIEKAEKEVFSRNFEIWLNKVRNIVIELHDEESEEIFFKALAPYTYNLSRSGELTICKNISPESIA